jgi:hypothetical protein
MDDHKKPPPESKNEPERPADEPEMTTGGTGTKPQEGVPNPGFTTRGD